MEEQRHNELVNEYNSQSRHQTFHLSQTKKKNFVYTKQDT
jgi:hypothetical protein